MEYDVVYQLRGERYAAHHALTTKDEAKAFAFCRDLTNFPETTVHYAITCDDGRVLHDTTKDGLLNDRR